MGSLRLDGIAPVVKIDNAEVLGLLGVNNSLAYKVHEIERHLHSGARWLEAATTPTGTHFADLIGVGSGAFQIDAGNDTWGSWVQITGADDTPVAAGKTYFDPHLMVIADVEKAATYFMQIGRGASGAAALSAGTFTELIYYAVTNRDTGILMVQTGRAPAGSLLWARCMAPGQDTATLDFYFGLHEYEG